MYSKQTATHQGTKQTFVSIVAIRVYAYACHDFKFDGASVPVSEWKLLLILWVASDMEGIINGKNVDDFGDMKETCNSSFLGLIAMKFTFHKFCDSIDRV